MQVVLKRTFSLNPLFLDEEQIFSITLFLEIEATQNDSTVQKEKKKKIPNV